MQTIAHLTQSPEIKVKKIYPTFANCGWLGKIADSIKAPYILGGDRNISTNR
jgi:hypothetical protein